MAAGFLAPPIFVGLVAFLTGADEARARFCGVLAASCAVPVVLAWLDFADLMQGFTKPMVYGFILATVGCYKGLTVRGGTQGVGRATTQAVVVASVLIIAADLFLTKLALYLGGKLF